MLSFVFESTFFLCNSLFKTFYNEKIITISQAGVRKISLNLLLERSENNASSSLLIQASMNAGLKME